MQSCTTTPAQSYCCLRRISGALGWAASLDILLLFYPVPRSCFLNRLLGAGFPLLIKYHRWLGHGTMWLLTLHGWGFYALWCPPLLPFSLRNCYANCMSRAMHKPGRCALSIHCTTQNPLPTSCDSRARLHSIW